MGIVGLDYLYRMDLRISLEGYYKKYSQLPSGIVPGVTDYIVLNNTGTGFGGREDDFQSFGYSDLTSTATGKAYGAELLIQKISRSKSCKFKSLQFLLGILTSMKYLYLF